MRVAFYEKAKYFHSLHVRGQPLVLFNIWDVGSAKAVEGAGARALATGSWSVAKANGYEDGERVPLDFAIENLARIARTTDLPVTIDLESGYGRTPGAVGRTVERSIEAGAVGCNLEDSEPGAGSLRAIAEQVDRIEHARKAAEAKRLPYFINVRSDVFFVQTKPQANDDERFTVVLERARAYCAAGADGLFVPGLVNASLIRRVAVLARVGFSGCRARESWPEAVCFDDEEAGGGGTGGGGHGLRRRMCPRESAATSLRTLGLGMVGVGTNRP